MFCTGTRGRLPAVPSSWQDHAIRTQRFNNLKKHISGRGSKPATPHVDARFHKHPLKNHISGRRSKPAIAHVDDRFRKHQLEKHSGIAANSKSTPAIPLVDAGLRKHQLETLVAPQHIQAQGKTAHCAGLFRGSCIWPSWVEVYAFIKNPPHIHCRGLTVLHISRHGIDICFQQESLCSRRHGLSTKHVSRLDADLFSVGTPKGRAGRLYTTRDDLTHLLVAASSQNIKLQDHRNIAAATHQKLLICGSARFKDA